MTASAVRVGSSGRSRFSLTDWDLAWPFVYGAVLTASFDIFLSIRVGPTLRACQFLMLVLICLSIFRCALGRPITWPLGYTYLLTWATFIVMFVPNTSYLPRSVGYAAWLIFNMLVVFSVAQLFDTRAKAIRLVRWYLSSFLFVGAFGTAQFALAVLGIASPLVVQWWIPGHLPRVNGFSYEPSYFALYMMIGVVVSHSLLMSGCALFARWHLKAVLLASATAVLLSSSRSGWVMLAAWFGWHVVSGAFRVLRLRIKLGDVRRVFVSALAAVALLGAIGVYASGNRGTLLLAGTGLYGATHHSVGERLDAFNHTVQAFESSPLVGYSLGGVAVRIGELRGVRVHSMRAAKDHEGMSVVAEVLAASGIVGFIPFCAYMLSLLGRPIRLAHGAPDRDFAAIVKAMTWALVVLLVMLQLNQNILRPYVWFHIAILSTLVAFLARTRVRLGPWRGALGRPPILTGQANVRA